MRISTPLSPFGVLAAALTLAAVLLALAAPASAHTGFESSFPADGANIDDPVTEITLTFTGAATPAGQGFVILDPEGAIREPDSISTADDLTWTLRFDEPLVNGEVGVRWKVAAPDAHPIEGSFTFTVTAPAAAVGPETEAGTGDSDEPGATTNSQSGPSDDDVVESSGPPRAQGPIRIPREADVTPSDSRRSSRMSLQDQLLRQLLGHWAEL